MSGGRRKEEPSSHPHSQQQQQQQQLVANGGGGVLRASLWSKALRSDSAWEDKDEFLDVIYWFRQIIAVILGVIWGIVPLKGFVGIAIQSPDPITVQSGFWVTSPHLPPIRCENVLGSQEKIFCFGYRIPTISNPPPHLSAPVWQRSKMASVRFCLINAGVLYLYFSSFQQIDEEEYGGTWELTKEGFMTSFALFLVVWIIFYTAIHYD